MSVVLLSLLATSWTLPRAGFVKSSCPRRANIRADYINADGKLVRSAASAEEEQRRKVRAALAAADAKLDELALTDEMFRAKSLAELGAPPPLPVTPQVDGVLAAAPAILGIFAVALFLLNNVGVFGDGGGSLDTMADELTARLERKY
mmetsp:Transcript_1970/g.6557  ORF Transcript_1970/g.6557 Transcript_1970/m.6557 type:complete len:148 (+) Transcript_1970:162-605(+)